MGPNAYAAGEALFDAQDPKRLIAQTSQPVLKPELPYEKTGQYAAGTTFAEGLVFFHGKWFLYYGCADSLVAVATAPAEAMSADLRMTTVRSRSPLPWMRSAAPGAEANLAASICTPATPSSSTATASPSRTTTTSSWSSTPARASPRCACTSTVPAWVAIASPAAGAAPSISASPAMCSREPYRRHHHAGHERRRLPAHHPRNRLDLQEGLQHISIQFASMRPARASRCSALRPMTM